MFGTQQPTPQGDRHPPSGQSHFITSGRLRSPCPVTIAVFCFVLRSSFFWPPGCVQTHCDLTDTRTQGAAHFGAVSFDCRLTVA